jgi:hypothetical protein
LEKRRYDSRTKAAEVSGNVKIRTKGRNYLRDRATAERASKPPASPAEDRRQDGVATGKFIDGSLKKTPTTILWILAISSCIGAG